MKIFNICLASLSLVTVASAVPTPSSSSLVKRESPTWEPQPIQTVEFKVESPDTAINGSGIIAKHEGAAVNYLFVNDSNNTMKLHFDPDTHTLFQPVNEHTNYRFNIINDKVLLEDKGHQPVTLDNYYLNYNDSTTGFAACKNINDPYNLTSEMPAILYYGNEKLPHNCSPMSLKVSSIFMVL